MRISKASGNIIPKPVREDLKYVNRTRDNEPGPFDTTNDDVLTKTYKGEDYSKIHAEFVEFLRLKREKERLMVF